jgi:nicotinate-nucleotide pyrophosphorylase (carboxylating)
VTASEASPELDAVEVLTAVMEALRDDLEDGPVLPDAGDPREAETGTAVIRSTEPGVLAGLPVAKEAFRRLGVRLRPLKGEGSAIAAGDRVALVGGSLQAILIGRRTVLRFLERLSAIASGRSDPDAGDPLDRYAAALGARATATPVGDNGPRFELEVEG